MPSWAAAGTGVLVGQLYSRTADGHHRVGLCGVRRIAVSLGAQALGAHNGYSSGTFRAVQLGARLAAPLWLALGDGRAGGAGHSGPGSGRS